MAGKIRNPPPIGVLRVVNRVVVPLLSSPLHRLASGRVMLLEYTGRRSGTTYTIPVGYTPWDNGDVLALTTGHTWPVNLRDGRAVLLCLRGRWVDARPTVVEDPAAVTQVLVDMGRRRGSRALGRLGIGLPGDRPPTPGELRDAAGRITFVRFGITPQG